VESAFRSRLLGRAALGGALRAAARPRPRRRWCRCASLPPGRRRARDHPQAQSLSAGPMFGIVLRRRASYCLHVRGYGAMRIRPRVPAGTGFVVGRLVALRFTRQSCCGAAEPGRLDDHGLGLVVGGGGGPGRLRPGLAWPTAS
jgi:hypothetical protein